MKKFGITVCVCLFIVLLCRQAQAVPVDAVDISGRNYADNVLKEIDSAEESIYVAMYAMYVRLGEKDNPAWKLVEALERACQRGVYVRVFLDKSPLIGNDLRRLNKSNDDAYKMLKEAGADVYFIKPELKLHEKLIVVDKKTVIDGSANWTQKALLENSESAEILRSMEFAGIKLKHLGELEDHIAAEPVAKREILEKVRIGNSFLEDKRLAPRMVTDSDGHSFDLYLWFLREFKDSGSPVIRLDYAAAARLLGITIETRDSKYRQAVRWVVDNLKNKYGLIDYVIDAKGHLDVRLLDYEDASKDYTAPREGYFNVAIAYWEYGFDKRLMLREKFAYMIAIYEQEIARPKLWWQKSLKGLSEKYHIGEWTLSYALRELKKLDILEVRHSRVEGGSDQDYSDREPNKYRFKELVSPQEKERQWKALEKSFGAGMVKEARELAGQIDEGNNLQAAKDFIRIIKQYGLENVKQATGEVEKLGADNPLRSIGYIVGVLKRMADERV
ncbi:MAG: hypothetical protein HZB36_08460 [Candidatus Omnitrophica bacterium]|nr:hypothetical protein [Candidatus Omnitrophota bacterium]